MGLANIGAGGAVVAAGLRGPVIDAGNRLRDGAGYVVLFLAAVVGFGVSAFVIGRVGEPETSHRLWDAAVAS